MHGLAIDAPASHHIVRSGARAGPQDIPCLLHGLAIERPNQVWCAGITSYSPVGGARRATRYSLSLARSGDRCAGITSYSPVGVRAGARVIPLSLARSGDRAAEPGLVRRHHIYIPIGRGFLYPVAVMDWASRRWTYRSVSRLLRKRSRASADRRSSPPAPSPASWWQRVFASRWTAAAAGWTTRSSSACGARARGHSTQRLCRRRRGAYRHRRLVAGSVGIGPGRARGLPTCPTPQQHNSAGSSLISSGETSRPTIRLPIWSVWSQECGPLHCFRRNIPTSSRSLKKVSQLISVMTFRSAADN